MPIGEVKWFNATNGLCIIELEDRANEMLVQVSAREGNTTSSPTLKAGIRVQYQVLKREQGETRAINLKAV